MDDAKHRRYTGVSNALILDNLQALGRVHGRIPEADVGILLVGREARWRDALVDRQLWGV